MEIALTPLGFWLSSAQNCRKCTFWTPIFLSTFSALTVCNILCFVPQGEPKKGISLWTNTSVQRCLYPLFQNQSPHFLLSSLFWKLSQPLGQDQQNSKQIYCQLPIIIFLWTLYFSRVFLEFSPKPVYSTMVAEKFQIYSVKTTANTFVSQKIESVQFYLCPQAKLSPRFL